MSCFLSGILSQHQEEIGTTGLPWYWLRSNRSWRGDGGSHSGIGKSGIAWGHRDGTVIRKGPGFEISRTGIKTPAPWLTIQWRQQCFSASVLGTCLVAVTKCQTKATWGRKVLFWLTVWECSPLWWERQGGGNVRQLTTLYLHTESRTEGIPVLISVFFFI